MVVLCGVLFNFEILEVDIGWVGWKVILLVFGFVIIFLCYKVVGFRLGGVVFFFVLGL